MTIIINKLHAHIYVILLNNNNNINYYYFYYYYYYYYYYTVNQKIHYRVFVITSPNTNRF